MGLALSVFLFGAIGAAIVAATTWYVLAFHDRFIADTSSPELGTFEILGVDENTAKRYGITLPKMVIAQLNSLKAKTNSAIASLKEAERALDPTDARPADPRFSELTIPERFSQPVEIDLKIADVELGWLVSLFVEQTRRQNLLRISISLDDDNKEAHVSGYLPGSRGYSFTRTPSNNIGDIVKEIASAIIQLSATKQETAFDVLDADVFENMIDAVAEYATLEKNRPLSAKTDPKAYQKILDAIGPQAKKWTRWSDLQWLASQVSERAEAWEDARTFYGNVLEVTSPGDPRVVLLQSKIGELEEKIASQQAVEQEMAKVGGVGVTDPRAAIAAVKQQTRKAPSEPMDAARIKPIWRLLGLKEPGSAKNVRIGVVGGAPWTESVNDASVDFLRGETQNFGSESFRNYQTEILRVARLVAPDSVYLYAPSPSASDVDFSTVDLLDGIKELIDDGKADIVLVTLDVPIRNEILNNTISELAESVLFVMAAGNNSGTSFYADLANRALVVSSVNLKGMPSSFTSLADGGLFAPGEDIPVISPMTGKEERRRGTGYSGALAAACAAILKATFPNATPAQLIEALRNSSKPLPGQEGPNIINVSAALDRLKSMVAHAGG